MKKSRGRLSLSFMLPILISVFLVTLVTAVLDIEGKRRELTESLKMEAQHMLDIAADTAGEAFWTYNTVSLSSIGDTLLKYKEIASVRMVDETGDVAYLASKSQAPYDAKYLIPLPSRNVERGKIKLGEIQLTVTSYYQAELIRQTVLLNLFRTVLMMSVLLLIIRILTRNLVTAIDRIADGVKVFSQGDVPQRIAVHGRSELAQLAERINAMFDTIVQSRKQLAQSYDELLHSRETLRITEARYRYAVEGSNDAIWDWNIVTNEFFVSPRGAQMVGLASSQGLTLEDWLSFVTPQDRRSYEQFLQGFRQQPDHYAQLQYRVQNANAEIRWLFCRGKGILEEDGRLTRVSGFCTDVTENIRAEESIHRLAYHDTLTGLPNRATLLNQLSAMLDMREPPPTGALLYLDLDNFKTINDAKGHAVGDRVISAVATALVQRVQCELIARIGGDEFAFVKSGGDTLGVSRLAGQVLTCLRRPLVIGEDEFILTGSVGIALFPGDGADVDTLLMNADNAMYQAKNAGGDQFRFYEQSMNERMVQRLQLQNDLRQGLTNQEFVLHYQPQIDVRTGNVVAVEALVRWQHPTRGLLAPAAFIGLAEESGLILKLGADILRAACRQSVQWEQEGYCDIGMAVNLSARQFTQKSIVEDILHIVEQTGMRRELLCIEITESIAMENLDSAIEIMNRLKTHGIRFSLDDFGTGYSSLNYLKNLPIDEIKIDRAFMQNVVQGSFETIVVSSLIQIAHSMGLRVVAEGIESAAQHGVLVGFQCDRAQGYLYSRPQRAEHIHALLRDKLM